MTIDSLIAARRIADETETNNQVNVRNQTYAYLQLILTDMLGAELTGVPANAIVWQPDVLPRHLEYTLGFSTQRLVFDHRIKLDLILGAEMTNLPLFGTSTALPFLRITTIQVKTIQLDYIIGVQAAVARADIAAYVNRTSLINGLKVTLTDSTVTPTTFDIAAKAAEMKSVCAEGLYAVWRTRRSQA